MPAHRRLRRSASPHGGGEAVQEASARAVLGGGRALYLTRDFVIPSNLAFTAGSRIGGDEWLRALPAHIEELKSRFSLELGDPYQPGGYTSWVAPARRPDGTAVVLKVCWRHPEVEHEPQSLLFWDGRGTVRLFDSLRTDSTIVLLLECCDPGVSLRYLLPEPEWDGVIASLLKRLWIEPPPGHPFRPLSDMMALWAGELEQRDSSAPHGTDRAFVREALRLMRELASSTNENVLLTTDLHATNVLAAKREPWLVIDPKPYVGDSAYDSVQHMLNCLERTAADPRAMVERLAGLADVDAQRLRLWLFVRCVQESVHDRVEEWAERAREVAAQVAP